MLKVIGIKLDLDLNKKNVLIFKSCIQDLLEQEQVKDLKKYTHHLSTNRLQHSINVAYYSYIICKKLKLDYRSAARAGLLHDLFNYDWRIEKQKEGCHAIVHPKIALRNAKKITNLNKIEEDAIVNHMWPLSKRPPIYKESIIVSLSDKYCAILEISKELLKNTVYKFKNLKIFNKKVKA